MPAAVSWVQYMKDGIHPSFVAALFFTYLKHLPIYRWISRRSFPVERLRSPNLNARYSGDLTL